MATTAEPTEYTAELAGLFRLPVWAFLKERPEILPNALDALAEPAGPGQIVVDIEALQDAVYWHHAQHLAEPVPAQAAIISFPSRPSGAGDLGVAMSVLASAPVLADAPRAPAVAATQT